MQKIPYESYTQSILVKGDSIDKVLSAMQTRIDSLSKHTQINEIGQNYFSDAISRDLYMFSTIVVIAGLVSWGWVEFRLWKQRRYIKAKIRKAVSFIEEENSEQQEKLKDMLFNVNRAMYGVSRTNKFHATTLRWALTALMSMIEIQAYSNSTQIVKWLLIIKEIINKVELSEYGVLKHRVQKFHKDINALRGFDFTNSEVIDLVDEIEILYMKKAYS